MTAVIETIHEPGCGSGVIFSYRNVLEDWLSTARQRPRTQQHDGRQLAPPMAAWSRVL
jgi:hypothetical protein